MPPEFIWLAWGMAIPILVFSITLWWSLHWVAQNLQRTMRMLTGIKPMPKMEARIRKTRPPRTVNDREMERAANAIRELILDEVAQTKIALWQGRHPSVDSALHALDVRRNLLEIEELKKKDASAQWFPEGRVPSSVEQAGRLLDNYVERHEGQVVGFKLAGKEQANVCGFDSAVRIIWAAGLENETIPLPSESELEISLAGIAPIALEFVLKSRRAGFYAERPDGAASVFSTYAAYELVRNLSRAVKGLDVTAFREGIDETIESVNQCLMPPEGDGGELLGYAYTKERKDLVCLSASHYASRVIGFAGQAAGDGKEREREVARGALGGKERQVLNFIRSCWVGEQGAFSWQPGKEPDILHARYGLQLLRWLLYNRLITLEQLDWLNPPSILRYIMACHSFGGFAVRPGFVPSLYATRAAVNSVKLLEIFRLRGLFAAGWDYFTQRRRFDEAAVGIPDFVKSCQDEEKGTFTEFPEPSRLAALGVAA